MAAPLPPRRPRGLLACVFWLSALGLIEAAGCGGGTGASGCGAADALRPGTDLSCRADDQDHSGEATYYTTADGRGACSFDATPNDLMIGAMNATDFTGSGACGGCVRLQGPNAEITIRIVDLCPECPAGNIDLSPQAFGRIADLAKGRVPITWQYVPCEVAGPVRYRFKEGSSQWWTAVQLRNHTQRVAKLEYVAGGSYHEVARTGYNFFVEPSGMGPGPYTFRVTDVHGHVLEDSGVQLTVGGSACGAGQFPACAGQ